MRLFTKLLSFLICLAFVNTSAQIVYKDEFNKIRELYISNNLDEVLIRVDSLKKINNNLWFESQLNFWKSKALIRLNNTSELYPLISRNYKIGKQLKNDSIVVYTNALFFEYYLREDKPEKALNAIDENLVILKNSKSPTSKTELAVMHGLIGGYYSNINDTLNYKKHIKLMYAAALKADTTYSVNNRHLASIYTTYADYINRNESEELSFKYYKKANALAHAIKTNYLINFTRIRIAGCLTSAGKPFDAIDTLRKTQKEKHVDVYVNHLMNEGFIRAFESAKMPDSIVAYKILFEEYEKQQTLKDQNTNIETTNSESNNDKNEISAPNNSFYIYFLIGFLIIGFIVVLYILINNKRSN